MLFTHLKLENENKNLKEIIENFSNELNTLKKKNSELQKKVDNYINVDTTYKNEDFSLEKIKKITDESTLRIEKKRNERIDYFYTKLLPVVENAIDKAAKKGERSIFLNKSIKCYISKEEKKEFRSLDYEIERMIILYFTEKGFLCNYTDYDYEDDTEEDDDCNLYVKW